MNTGYTFETDTKTVCRRLFATCIEYGATGKAIEAVSLSDGSMIEAQRRLLDVVRSVEIERHAAVSDECTCDPAPDREGMNCPACRAVVSQTIEY